MKPRVVILCGGRGTRLRERTESVPKALVEIGGGRSSGTWSQIYAAQGFERFVLATGYMGEAVADFAAGQRWPAGVLVECVDTGLDTPTGGRVAALRDRLGAEQFCVTYADGVADVDLDGLLDFHRAQGALATVTVVRPNLQWGVAKLDGAAVTGFVEKPRSEHWINGGSSASSQGSSATWTPAACSSASRWSASPPTASSAPTATRASGTAWTPTRTRSSSTTSGPPAMPAG